MCDWQNHLASATVNGQTTSFTYDGDGNLAQRIDATGTVDYVGDAYERNVTTGVETKRYALGGQLVASRQGGAAPVYLHQDDLGSTVSASNGVSYAYDANGNLVTRGTQTLQYNPEQK